MGGEVPVLACRGGLAAEVMRNLAAGGQESSSAEAMSTGQGVRQLRMLGRAKRPASGRSLLRPYGRSLTGADNWTALVAVAELVLLRWGRPTSQTASPYDE